MKPLTSEEKNELLRLARQSASNAANQSELPSVNLHEQPENFRENRASFVTITKHGDLRGCIGTLEPYQPLVLDVIEHAAAAAIRDFRFSPVRPDELEDLEFEISVLTHPRRIKYTTIEDLRCQIRPGKDGVVLQDGLRRATFLPQVWESLPTLDEFMGHLCMKMGSFPDAWRTCRMNISVYQVQEFKEISEPKSSYAD